MNTKEILSVLCSAEYTPSADNETAAAIKSIMAPLCKKVYSDNLGNVICEVTSEGDEHVVLSAHMDKIGLVVTGKDKNTGMLSFTRVGSPDLRTLTACRVKVCGKKTLRGCISSTPPHLSSGDRTKAPTADSLYIDCGLPFSEIDELVSIGDTVLYDSPVTELVGGKLSGAYMDNSAGCCAVINAVKLIKENGTKNKITAVFTTREEVGKGGAVAAFNTLKPDRAYITDVSFGACPGIPRESSAPLASGAMICITPILQKEMSQQLISVAEQNGIAYTTEVMGARTMTDSDVAVNSGFGVKTALASIPLLNMHTAVETLAISDIEAVGALLYNASKGE